MHKKMIAMSQDGRRASRSWVRFDCIVSIQIRPFRILGAFFGSSCAEL